jgi:hypothetical protein
LTLHQIDQTVRGGGIRLRGQFFALADLLGPTWDAPLHANGRDIAARLVERWGSGSMRARSAMSRRSSSGRAA